MTEKNSFEGVPMTELKDRPTAEAMLVAPHGMGFGEGAISYDKRANDEVPSEELTKVSEMISTADILITVDTDKLTGEQLDDDGCGDGRGITNAQGEIVELTQGDKKLKKSLNRAKVFGGGATMALAAKVAVGEADVPLQQLFRQAMTDLDDHDIDYGAHSDEHAHGHKSGCGAIDNAPAIIANAAKYRDGIYATLLSLDDTIDAHMLDDVLDNFEAYNTDVNKANYKGKDVLDDIASEEKVIKKLTSDHYEMFIVLNDVEGYTVNQHTVRDATDENVQVFTVDMWRIANLASRLYEDEPEEIQQRAILGELVYTLATAATLTKGDLPVYRIRETRDKVYA